LTALLDWNNWWLICVRTWRFSRGASKGYRQFREPGKIDFRTDGQQMTER
jgi:hypothetical protein